MFLLSITPDVYNTEMAYFDDNMANIEKSAARWVISIAEVPGAHGEFVYNNLNAYRCILNLQICSRTWEPVECNSYTYKPRRGQKNERGGKAERGR